MTVTARVGSVLTSVTILTLSNTAEKILRLHIIVYTLDKRVAEMLSECKMRTKML